MKELVPASTKISPNRVGNIDTDRLRRRAAWFDEVGPDGLTNKTRIARECDGRKRMRDVAREILEVQRELERRDLTRDEDIARWTAELQPLLDGMLIPEMRLQLRPEDLRWLGRNLHIENLGHPDHKIASRLVRKLLDATASMG